jgi:hypothetical protein
MIFESYPWKQEIERLLKSLRKWSSKPNSERAEFYIQRAVLFSAFAVRKLIENRKLTDALRDKSIRCKAYRSFQPVSDRVSTFSGLADVSDDYDMTKAEEVMRTGIARFRGKPPSAHRCWGTFGALKPIKAPFRRKCQSEAAILYLSAQAFEIAMRS